MNLILFNPNDLTGDGHVCITDPRRLAHLHEVHRSVPGDLLTVGVQGSAMGKAMLKELTAERAYFQLETLDEPPPPPLPSIWY